MTNAQGSSLRSDEKSGDTLNLQHTYGDGIIHENLLEILDEGYSVAEIIFVDPSGRKVVLNDLLPDGVRLVKIPDFLDTSYDPNDHSIVYGNQRKDPETHATIDFWSPSALLILLHEIGHATYDSPMSAQERSVFGRLGGDTKGSISVTETRIAQKLLRSEKTAWDHALELYKAIQEKGITCEPALGPLNKVETRAGIYYRSYETPYTKAIEQAQA